MDGKGGRTGCAVRRFFSGNRHGRRRPDDPAGCGRGGADRGLRAQQQGGPPPVSRGEREPTARYVVDGIGFADFAQHRADRAAVQRLLHGPQHVARVCGRHQQHGVGVKAHLFDAGAIGDSAFALGHVFGDPQHRTPCGGAGGERKREAGGARGLRLAGGEDLVQRRARKAAAQRRIDGGKAERQPAGGLLQRFGPSFERADGAPQALPHVAFAGGLRVPRPAF